MNHSKLGRKDTNSVCFLDMDGVLADFVGAACRIHNRPNPYLDYNGDESKCMSELWGVSRRQLMRPLNYSGFWYELQKTEEADAIVEAVVEIFGEDRVAVFTKPVYEHESCPHEKVRWIEKHFPFLKDRVLMGGEKHLAASPEKLLIDDHMKQVVTFKEAGGLGILVPRPWNVLRHVPPMDYVTTMLDKYYTVGVV